MAMTDTRFTPTETQDDAQQVPQYGNITSVPTRLLIQAMKDGKPGDMLTDEQLEQICREDCRPGKPGYPHLEKAKKYLTDNGVVWERIRGAMCIKCLEPSEVNEGANTARRHILRKSKSAVKKLGSRNMDGATMEEKQRQLTHMGQFGALRLFSESSTTRQIEAREINEPPDMKKLLEHWK